MNSTQLDLWQADLERSPWGGKSPRGLTRGHILFILKPKAEKDDCFFVDPDQLDLWPITHRAPRRYLGAPSIWE